MWLVVLSFIKNCMVLMGTDEFRKKYVFQEKVPPYGIFLLKLIHTVIPAEGEKFFSSHKQ
jgi:hypothetical protein